MPLCPLYRGGPIMGKIRPICRYSKRDKEGRLSLCGRDGMLICEEWLKKVAGISLFEEEKKNTQMEMF